MRAQADNLSNRAALLRSGETVAAILPVLRAVREARGNTRSPVRGGRASVPTTPVTRGRSGNTASESRGRSGNTASESRDRSRSPSHPPSGESMFLGFSILSSPRPSFSRPVGQRSPLSPRSPSGSQAVISHVPLTGSPSSFPRGNPRVEIPCTRDGQPVGRRDSGREALRFSPDNPLNEGGFIRGDGSSDGRGEGGASGGRERSDAGRGRTDRQRRSSRRRNRSSTSQSDARKGSDGKSGQSGSGGGRQ